MLVESFNIIDCILLGILAVAFIAQVYWYGRYMAAPARKIRRDRKKPAPLQGGEESLAPVSVILCAHNEAYNLSQYLQALLTQDYPEYEVIVVDDGSEDETRAEIERYLVHDPRLHMTFVPYGARVGSTKKLALTLAAKAAQYDYLLLTARNNILSLWNQKGSDETFLVEKSLTSHYDVDFIANLFYGEQYLSVNKEMLAVMKAQPTAPAASGQGTTEGGGNQQE